VSAEDTFYYTAFVVYAAAVGLIALAKYLIGQVWAGRRRFERGGRSRP